MPPLFPSVQHLPTYLFRVGPRSGDGSLTWAEVIKWQEASGVRLSAWEAETLVAMAREYCFQMQESRDPNCAAPYLVRSAEDKAKHRKDVADRLKAALRAAAKPKNRMKNQGKK